MSAHTLWTVNLFHQGTQDYLAATPDKTCGGKGGYGARSPPDRGVKD